MTKRERAQVVELLRCAADEQNVWRAAFKGGFSGKVRTLAYDVHAYVWERRDSELYLRLNSVPYRERLLECVAVVEEGSWP